MPRCLFRSLTGPPHRVGANLARRKYSKDLFAGPGCRVDSALPAGPVYLKQHQRQRKTYVAPPVALAATHRVLEQRQSLQIPGAKLRQTEATGRAFGTNHLEACRTTPLYSISENRAFELFGSTGLIECSTILLWMTGAMEGQENRTLCQDSHIARLESTGCAKQSCGNRGNRVRNGLARRRFPPFPFFCAPVF